MNDNRWRYLNKSVIMPRVCPDGITHLMGLHGDSDAWVLRCRLSYHSKTWRTRPGGDVDCMTCLSMPDSTMRLLGVVVKLRATKDPAGTVHEAWTTGEFDAMTTCGEQLYLPVDEQTQDPVSCPRCLQ
jgi:hypothetical protein